MNRRDFKNKILAVLHEQDLLSILKILEEYPAHLVLNPLFIALCHRHELVRWHAVCGFGFIVPRVAEKDPESARIIMRRFLWSLNDESGGIGWGSPEAMAEIMYHSPLLRSEYVHMLLSYMREDGDEKYQDGNYLELPLLQRGLLWGVGRICQGFQDELPVPQIVEDVTKYIDSTDLQVAGLAIWCLGLLASEGAEAKIAKFLHTHDKISIFLDNTLQYFPISTLAEKALSRCMELRG